MKKIYFSSIAASILSFILNFLFLNCSAQWSTNPAVNNAICTAVNNQQSPTITTDGSGGAIITWQDIRGGGTNDIYAQRINAAGVLQWTADGVVICAAANTQQSPTIIADGSGGAIITWQDNRSGINIYAQRINASGTVQWTADGVAVCTAANTQRLPNIISDGSQGAIITWEDSRNGTDKDIYVQRINAAGTAQWAADGIAICTATDNQQLPNIISDGSGGAIITWQDFRDGAANSIYAQRINASGTVQWTADGEVICTAVNYGSQYPTITTDGSGGAIITWMDNRQGLLFEDNIYAQRINAAGIVQWTADGVAICTEALYQQIPTITTDGSGGAIITWYDGRGTAYDIYAQRINAVGVVQWTTDGVVICTAADIQEYPTIITDGSGGAIITWQDKRSASNRDIYAQRINAAGTVQWTANGVLVSNAANSQLRPQIIYSTACASIITWYDFRGGTAYDIYAFGLDCSGVPLPIELFSFTATCNNQTVELRWTTASEINNNYFTIDASPNPSEGGGLEWQAIGTVKGAGNSSTIKQYEFTYESPRLRRGKGWAFRLKQTDYDGKERYFGPVSVRCNTSDITIYPTISAGLFFITGDLTDAEVCVYSVIGEKIYLTSNVQHLTSDKIDLSSQPQGTYFIQIKSDKKSFTQKLIIQK